MLYTSPPSHLTPPYCKHHAIWWQMKRTIAFNLMREWGTAVLPSTGRRWSLLDTTPRGPLKVNRRFGGTCVLSLQGRRLNQARNQSEADSKWIPFSRGFLAWPFLRPWRWRWHVPPKRLLTFNGLHDVTSQNRELFVTNQSVLLSTDIATSLVRLIYALWKQKRDL
jgi:hypothetical protein